MVSSYRDLDVWRLAMKLAENIYYVTHAFPHRETYALSSQLQRAAVSVASNIAEGHARGYTKDYLLFIAMAMGSLAELETQLELSTRLKYVDENDRINYSATLTNWDGCYAACTNHCTLNFRHPSP